MTGYHIPEDVLSAHLDGETVLLDLRAKRYYQLNATASALWKAIERQPATEEAMVDALTQQFEVDRETAQAAVRSTLADLTTRRLLAS